jgi:lysophospholipase L1-like esterase
VINGKNSVGGLALKKSFVLLLLFVLLVLVFTIGPKYFNHNVEVANSNAAKEFKKEQQQELQKQKEKEALLEKNKFNSVLDWLKYTSTQEKQITLSVFGSSVTQGAGSSSPDKKWSELLTSFLNNQQGISPITLNSSGFGGYTTQRLISENKINDVVASNPDLVIIEPTIINNYLSNISIDQTEKDVLYFISQIKAKNPNCLIIIQSSDQIKGFQNQNKLGSSYQDYVNALKTFAQENHLNYVDVYSGIESLREQNHKQLEEILADDRHPNDLGYQYWFETLKTSFEKDPLVNN